ncbi:MAG: FG-GAP-like repeat-containing protein, partial [Candidatus Cloacimonadales bacterium]
VHHAFCSSMSWMRLAVPAGPVTAAFQYPKFCDMDNDGDMDIVINYGGSVHSCNVLINNGDGSFNEENIISYDSDIGRFDIGDVNNDGFEDILIATNQNPYLLVNNNFQFTSYQIDDLPWANVLLIDMDGDFNLDLVLNQDLPSQTMIIYNDGTGDFYEEHLINMFSVNILKDINDYNNDGYPDFAFTMNPNPPNLYISFNNGDGTISIPDVYNFDVVNYLVVKSADLNGNGYNDLLVASHPYPGPSQGASILYNDGNGNFLNEQIPFLQITPNSIHLDCDAGNTAFEIRSNSQWQIEQNATWITSIEPISGIGTTTINVDFEENPHNYSRSVTLNISGDNVESEELVITQSASNVDSNENTISLTNINLNNYPNPFNPSTTINYTLPFDADKTVIEIYNVKGQLIKILKVDSFKSLKSKAIWDGKDYNQKNVSSGIYLYRLIMDESVSEIKKMIMIK